MNLFSKHTDVALVICPPYDTRAPPMGLAYIATYLKYKKLKVELFDLNIDLYNLVDNDIIKYWNFTFVEEWTQNSVDIKLWQLFKNYLDNYIINILKNNPKMICFSINAANFNFTANMIKTIRLKNQNVILIVGGPNSDEEQIWKHDIVKYLDYTILGEGEIALWTLFDKIRTKKEVDNIPGVQIIKKKKFNKPNPVDLKKLPFPSYVEFDLKKYDNKALPISTSRGCYGRCRFCSDWINRPHRGRRGKDIFTELYHHYTKYSVQHYIFTDLVISANIKEIEEFCNLAIKHKLKLHWSSNAVINMALANISDKLRKVGCDSLTFGIESFSPRVIKLMNKPFKYEHIMPVLSKMKKSGIKIGVNIVVGFPGESKEDFEENLTNFSLHSKYIDRIDNLNLLYIYGRSHIHENLPLYNIALAKNNAINWYTKDNSNTYKKRIVRLKKMIDLLSKENIPYPKIHSTKIRKDLEAYYAIH